LERVYDIFEHMPDGSLIWRGAITGHEAAVHKLQEFAANSTNEFRLMHVATKTLIASINSPRE
jgi:hypothetical protein